MSKAKIKQLVNQLNEMGLQVKINQQLGKISVDNRVSDWEAVQVRSQNIRESLEEQNVDLTAPEYQVTVMLESLTKELSKYKQTQLNETTKIKLPTKTITQSVYENIDLDKAEIILAAKSVSGEFQKSIEKMAKLQVEDVISLVDQIGQHFGRNDAQTFSDAVNSCFDQVLEVLRTCKDQIDDQIAYTLEGKTPEPDIAQQFDPEDQMDELEIDADDMGEDDLDAEIDALDSLEGPADEPLGRARKR